MISLIERNRASSLIIIILLGIISILLLRSCGQPTDVTIVSEQAKKDSLQLFRDALGQEHAKNITIIADRDQFKKMYFAKDSDYRALQLSVDKNTMSAILLRNNSTASIKTGSNISYRDTILKRVHDSIQITIYPTYSRVFKSKWFNDSIVANKDSIFSRPAFFNEYMITQRYERKNIFHKKYCYVDVTSKNPYTTTTALKSFLVASPKRNIGKFIFGSIAVGVISGIFLSKKL